MDSTEQPPKKRKLYDPSQPPPPSQPPSPPPPPPPPPHNPNDDPTPKPPLTPPPLSSEEIQSRRRNQGDIRNVYENYKTIQRCISSVKNPRLSPEIEEAFLSLISSSRGCPSVQRILSEVIPCYASYCPTALEAAAQVVINMHNWNVPLVSRGEDLVGVSFETAKNCISGLIDICCTASWEAPTSSVIQGICSVVFLSAATFFANSFEDKNIFQIIDKESFKVQDSALTFAQLKQRVLEEDTSPLIKLMKFRALCFLRILFLCPKNFLAACFELFSNHGVDGFCIEGKYFLTQLCYTLNFDGKEYLSKIFEETERHEANTDNMRLEKNDLSNGRPDFDLESSKKNKEGLLECCLLGLVLGRNPSLKKWLFSRYRKLQNSASSEAVFQVTNAFQRIFESFCKQVQDTGETDDNSLDSSRYVSRHSLVRGTSNRQRNFHETSGKDFSSQHHDKPLKKNLSKNVSDPYLKHHSSIVSVNSDSHSNTSSNHDSGGSKRMDIDSKEDGNRCHAVSGSIPALYPPATSNQIVWYSDGDTRAMDVFSASRQLWLGSLAPDVSEAALRFELERFGPIENFMFFHAKQFLLVEYESIIDAIKARDFFQRYSPWGYPIHVKFIDAGLGTRGTLEDVAIGSSCHVFVGNVLNQWVRDEIVRETMKSVHRGPRLVTDLTSEGALLLEFENPEEAANAMACIRQFRKGNNSFRHTAGPTDFSRPCPRFWNSGPTSVSSNIGNMCTTFLGSPHGQAVGSPSSRMHQSNLQFKINPESTPPEFLSPRVGVEQGSTFQSAQKMHSNMISSVCMDTPGTSGPTIALPQPIQASPYMQPLYPLPSNTWDGQGFSHHIPHNTAPPSVMSSNIHSTPAPSPFIQASVTPMSQVPGSSVHSYNHMLSQPFEPPPMPSIPNPQLDLPPPLPPSPPMVPPPPSMDPPSSTTEPSSLVTAVGSMQIAWQGTLSKSGVHFCNIYANRLDTDLCRYSVSVSEPAGWPVKLDMTKRTDCRHIKATFTSTPPHRREVCQLFPSSPADHKGLQDFISYLKQRDCAGVIKIPSMKPLWARLLFILPNSSEACSMLSMAYDATDCLIAVILPKESNAEVN